MVVCRRFASSLVLSFTVLLSIAATSSSQEPAPAAGQGSNCVAGPIAFGLIEATSNCFRQTATDQWQSSEAVVVNGVSLPPISGTKVILTGPSAASPGGELAVQANISVAGVTFVKGPFSWKLPAGGRGEEKDAAVVSVPSGQKLFGFGIGGSVAVRFGWDANSGLHYTKFIANLQLPDIFRNGPGADAGGLTATVGLRVDSQGVHADSVKAQVSNAYIGALQVKDLCLSYTSAGSTTTPCSPPRYGAEPLLTCNEPGNVSRWDGSADIVLPTADRPEVGVWAGVQNGQFSYAGGQATKLGNSVPIAEGLYLDKVGLAVCVTPPPMKFKGAAGINFGPTVAGKAALTLDGSMTFVNSRPWVLEADGGLSIYSRKVAGGFLRYTANGMIDFGFNAKFNFGSVASITGDVTGWLQARTPVRFNVTGKGNVCVAGKCVTGELAVSSVGAAGCFKLVSVPYPVVAKDKSWSWSAPWKVHTEVRYKQVRGGAGIRWSGGAPSVMGDACDIGPYSLARLARIADDRVSIRVPSEPVLALQVKGASGAPRVELIAPNGRRYTSSSEGVIVPGSFAAAPNRLSSTTSLLIAHPLAGIWRVRSLAGSITNVSQAQADEPPSIQAGVGMRGNRFERVLGYSYQPDPSHSVVFVERGGNIQRTLGPAAGVPCPGTAAIRPRPLCGRLRFAAGAGPTGPRAIYAFVSDSQGAPTEDRIVARYNAPAEPEPSSVSKLTVRREGETLRIGWTGSSTPDPLARPVAYDVDVNLSDGRKLLVVVGGNARTASVPAVEAQTSAAVAVAAVRSDDTQGGGDALALAAGRSAVTR